MYWRHSFCFQDFFEHFQFVVAVFSAVYTDFFNVLVFLQWWHVGLGLSTLVFVICECTLFICSSSGASKTFSSNSRSRCVIICSYVSFPILAFFCIFQVWRHFGVYELFDDGMSRFSECVCGQFLNFIKKLY